ncbi:uncharacterized protein [Cicer arietinum]|uniref:Uncharacterized protein LOC101504530 n=1 Tax=Cicer arietinum TaxID=3827 RepID=A0A1S2XDZ1_CICAR|nr:uncharacterized protein LOC101504530 [Cicer arietinum]
MPFPWKKKNRVTRISQIVADLQSPKRGGSLVVETGFPTSLIDLFVKNRSRFNKSRFKKPVRSEILDPSPPPPPPPPSPVTSSPPIHDVSVSAATATVSDHLSTTAADTSITASSTSPPIHDVSTADIPGPNHPIGEITDGVVNHVPVNEFSSALNSKLITVKMLTVIILAASVKELTVAMTVSAFALLFLENALKRVVSILKPCSNVSVAMKSMFQKVLFQKNPKEVCETVTVLDREVQISSLNLNCCMNDEIEVVETKSELGICCELNDSLVSECKIKRSRSGRFRSIMVKKLKKFRSSKKEKKEKIENTNKEDEVELSSDVSSVVGEDKEEIKNEVDCGITCSQESVVVGNSGYIILVIIVLIGLIVGRLPALILTIGWCFLVKMVRGVWRSKNGSLSKCSSSRS